MAIIAKGTITLNSVNDAFTVSLSPSSCVISANWNGQNLNYSNAYTDITVYRGTTKVPFSSSIESVLGLNAHPKIQRIDQYTVRVLISENTINPDILNGNVKIKIQVGNDFTTTATMTFAVVRETSMLDWILDWERRKKTEIAGEYIITPKIFVGTSENGGQLTGTYIGPAFDGSARIGVFGYLNGNEIFHLDNTGGVIGGWEIENGGIQTTDGALKILSEGTIISAPAGIVSWELKKDGTASFAGGKVKMSSNGDAYFEGEIHAVNGIIGNWKIGNHSLYNDTILLDSDTRFIGIRKVGGVKLKNEPSQQTFYTQLKINGGVAIFSNEDLGYGIECWAPGDYNIDLGSHKSNLVFSLGSLNKIAGWFFDESAIYLGTKNNTAKQNTASVGDITIGTSGLRGKNWYIDSDGEISFVDGLLHFTMDGGEICGWSLSAQSFVTDHIALHSGDDFAGIYLSASNLKDIAASSYSTIISANGGIFFKSDATNCQISGYNKWGSEGEISRVFLFNSNGICQIGNWYFTIHSFFIGEEKDMCNVFTDAAGSITLGKSGVRGHKWRFEADGSGAIAGGKIYWDSDGEIHFDSNVIFTGKVSADNITSGTITTAAICNKDYWGLLKDGSGYLASKNITWDSDGKSTFNGTINAVDGTIGGFTIGQHYIGVKLDQTNSEPTADEQAEWASLTISKEFIKVGGRDGYAMFGSNVIPGSAGRAFTATGRIVNNASNFGSAYGVDQANYGLFIDVTGGTKNYGIKSNAALLAPSVVTTSATFLTFNDTGKYSLDFSQNNLILLFAPTAAIMRLPEESSIAQQFGLGVSLPDDFVTTVTIILRPESKAVTIKNIYDGTGNQTEFVIASTRTVYKELSYGTAMAGKTGIRLIAPSCITLLISKKDGFRYTVLNYECSFELI